MTEIAKPENPAPDRRWVIAVLLLAALAGAIVASQLLRKDAAPRHGPVTAGPKGIAVPPNLPGIVMAEEPKIAPEEAKKLNAVQPFVPGAIPSAKPFRLLTNVADLNKAADCLTAAIYYEAGNETVEGQKAVAQVILNRVRHPAYPKTVCGVIFQGSDRKTGCQFTFTCDGAINRVPSENGWRRANTIARLMLSGAVYAPVGWATHYHTDWVFPSWSAKLDKVRQEGTHLFFRWRAFWGTPAAFRGRYAGNEENQPKLASLSAFHIAPAVATDTGLAGQTINDALLPGEQLPSRPLLIPNEGTAMPPAANGKRMFQNPMGDYHIYLVSRSASPESLLSLSLKACGDRQYCKVMMWTDPAIVPAALPVSDQALSKLSFSYLRNRSTGFEKPLWNCAQFQRSAPGQCIKHHVAAQPAKPQAAAAPKPEGAPGATP